MLPVVLRLSTILNYLTHTHTHSLSLSLSISLTEGGVIMSKRSHTVELRTFASRDPVAIRLPEGCTVDKAKGEICKRLGLQPNSLSLFGLFLGPIEHPIRLLMENEVIQIGAKLSLQRWNFDVEKEIKAARKDDVAINLLYNEATYHFVVSYQVFFVDTFFIMATNSFLSRILTCTYVPFSFKNQVFTSDEADCCLSTRIAVSCVEDLHIGLQ